MEESKLTNLSLEEQCNHELWNVRLKGYTEVAKLFQKEDEKAPIFNHFAGLLSKFVGDTNPSTQEKGVEAVLMFLKNGAVATETVKEVMPVTIQKCFAAEVTKTKELAVQISLMYVKIGKQKEVVEELAKGLEHKNSKIVARCCSAFTLCLREYGTTVINGNLILKIIRTLLQITDETVRKEAKVMVFELFRWLKDPVEPELSLLKTELEKEFPDLVATAKNSKEVFPEISKVEDIQVKPSETKEDIVILQSQGSDLEKYIFEKLKDQEKKIADQEKKFAILVCNFLFLVCN